MFIILSPNVRAQDINILQKEINKAESIIKQTTLQLNSNKTTQKNRVDKLFLISSNLKVRQNLVTNINKEVYVYNTGIRNTESEVRQLNNEIKDLQEQYKNIISATYIQLKQNSYLQFILSANSFHDIFRRLHYLRLHSSSSQSTVTKLEENKALLADKTKKLNSKRSSLSKSLRAKKNEMSELSKDQKLFNSELSKLESEEKNLTTLIVKNKSLVDKLQDEIKRIIEEEVKKTKNETNKVEIKINTKLSSEFAKNKGKLPAPISQGIVVSKFGTHAHPLQKGVTINNKGINISVHGNSSVRSIFNGKVTKVFFFQGLGNNVMIRHGSYISVYSNLSKVSVKMGEEVKTSQQIGEIKPQNGSTNSSLHFELWKETTPQNPEIWID